jgi:hypothetical protein
VFLNFAQLQVGYIHAVLTQGRDHEKVTVYFHSMHYQGKVLSKIENIYKNICNKRAAEQFDRHHPTVLSLVNK